MNQKKRGQDAVGWPERHDVCCIVPEQPSKPAKKPESHPNGNCDGDPPEALRGFLLLAERPQRLRILPIYMQKRFWQLTPVVRLSKAKSSCSCMEKIYRTTSLCFSAKRTYS